MAETKAVIESRLRAEHPEIADVTITHTADGVTEERTVSRGAERDTRIAEWTENEHARQMRADEAAAIQTARDVERTELEAIHAKLSQGRPVTPQEATALQRITAAQALRAMGG